MHTAFAKASFVDFNGNSVSIVLGPDDPNNDAANHFNNALGGFIEGSRDTIQADHRSRYANLPIDLAKVQRVEVTRR